MTQTRKITEQVSVAPFVSPDEVPALAGEFKTLINNRPDCEEPGQATSAEIEAAARAAGVEYVHLPVVPGQLGDDAVARFGELLAEKPGPVLAICRTGTRSASMWALSEAGKRSADDILSATRAAGYDLSALRPRLEP